MSWMDSWSRPTKSQAAPPPLYLAQGDNARYCHTCGRIIGARRTNSSKANAGEVKYCSDKCKHNKPKAFDKSVEGVLLELLLDKDSNGLEQDEDNAKSKAVKSKRTPKKGDPRNIIKMSDVETAVFGNMRDPDKIYGRNKNRAKRGLPDRGEWRSIDMEGAPQQVTFDSVDEQYNSSENRDVTADSDVITIQTHVRPSQLKSDVNGSIGGEKGWAEKVAETPEMLQKRLEGQKRAENRELVRNAARRAVAFGLWVDRPSELSKRKRADDEQVDQVQMKCEALMNGSVVDPSFAKGDWSVRWRED